MTVRAQAFPGGVLRPVFPPFLPFGQRRPSAHFTRSEIEGPRAGVDPLLPLEIGPVNGREAQESGLRRADGEGAGP